MFYIKTYIECAGNNIHSAGFNLEHVIIGDVLGASEPVESW